MNDPKATQALINLGNAIDRLEEALNEDADHTVMHSLIIDGTIQRFEFVIELYWKTFKRLLALEGIHAHTPKEALQQAFKVYWTSNEAAWLQMLRDRNETSHVYDESAAKRIYANIKQNLPELMSTYALLKEKYGNN